MNKRYEAVVVGAGAAGLMCGLQMGKRGKRTLIIERSKNIAEKIRISGGGRCNFTNLSVTQDNFLSQNPHFAISALKKFTQDDFIKMVENNDISYYEKTLGQLFCDGSAMQIINMLVAECKIYNVTLLLDCSISLVTKKDEFYLETSKGIFQAQSLIIASGGLSIPKLGSSDFGYQIAFIVSIQVCKNLNGQLFCLLRNDLLTVCVKNIFFAPSNRFVCFPLQAS